VSQYYTIQSDQIGMELDEFLCRLHPLTSKRLLRRLVREGAVTVNAAPAAPAQRLRADDVVGLEFDEDDLPVALEPRPIEEPLDLLYEDAHSLVVDKPADLLVEPDRWDETRPNLLSALHALAVHRGGEAGAEFRPRLVHRLDKDTSGAVVIAKSIEAERVLGAAFEHGQVEKRYLALVEGEHPLADGASETIELAIGPNSKRDGSMCARKDGKPAATVVRVEQRFHGFTLLSAQPLSGRTHQIRVHLAAKGFPLAVDPLYGRRRALKLSELKSSYRHKPGTVESPLIARLTLHAASVEFPDVQSGARRVRVEAPLPRDFERTLRQLAKVRPARTRPRSSRS
jgi:23S rRNA pseudouridine1911/1915/1917 synthase